MIGLKENVILGKLIPAGTGMKKYRNIRLDTDNEILDNEEGFEDEFRTDLQEGGDLTAPDTIDTETVDTYPDEFTEEFDESDFFDAEFEDEDEDFDFEDMEEADDEKDE